MFWIILILLAWAVILGIAIAKRRKKVKGLTTKHDEHSKEGHGESTLSTIKHLPWPVIFGALLVICTIWTFADYRPGETAFVWNGFWGLETSAQFLIGLVLVGLVVLAITSALKGGHGKSHSGGHHEPSILGLTVLVWSWIAGIVIVIVTIVLVIKNWNDIPNPFNGPTGPVAVTLDIKGQQSSHRTPFKMKILTGFQIHCVEDIDVWVPDCRQSGGGSWNKYNPVDGPTNLPRADRCGSDDNLVYHFRRHQD